MRYIKKYYDVIVQEFDYLHSEEIWRNDVRDERWKSDNDNDSAHQKMLELNEQYNLIDYENAPRFDHYIYEQKFKVYANGDIKPTNYTRVVFHDTLLNEIMSY